MNGVYGRLTLADEGVYSDRPGHSDWCKLALECTNPKAKGQSESRKTKIVIQFGR